MCTPDKEESLELLCEKYPYVIHLIRIMGVDESDVDDLAAEVFIDAFKGIGGLKDKLKIVPWLRKITANKVSKYFRKRAKRREISNMVKTEMGEMDIFDIVADEVTVEKILQKAEEKEMVREMINSLSDVGKRILRMRFWGDYKHSEIAEIMNININTEKSIYRRSLRQLKADYFKRIGEGDRDE